MFILASFLWQKVILKWVTDISSFFDEGTINQLNPAYNEAF